MIPDAIFLRLAAGFAHPTPDELVLLKQQQQVMFQEGRNVSLHQLALQAGFLTQDQATEFEAIAGGGTQATPPPNDGAKAPSGRAGVKAPSGRSSGVRPSARQRRESGRAGTGRVSGRAQALKVSGRQPVRSSSPLVPIAVGAVVLACLGAAVYFSKAKPEDLTAKGPDPTELEASPADVGGPEQYHARARALRPALFARLERGQGQRALNELDVLIAEWTREP
ncbi:MAG: hypothetical protein KDD82_20885, partial [Planctomycetes bacterium]|nr:hypothetical protein [Planctomycetota bacterium]